MVTCKKKYWYVKVRKWLYTNPLCQWAFRNLPSGIGIPITHYISKRSRTKPRTPQPFFEKNDPIFNFCKQAIEPNSHHDFYIFGHLHATLAFRINENSFYYNVGDWINHFTYGQFDGKEYCLLKFM